MRQIKFRGKDKYTNKWVFGDLVRAKGVSIDGLYDRVMVGGYHVIEESVGQFTGLPDKVGREIYEHDIVTWYDSDGNQRMDVVKWMRGGLCLCNANYTVGSYGGLEVIGNTIDNPELLKGGKE